MRKLAIHRFIVFSSLLSFLLSTQLVAETGKITLAWEPINDPELASYSVAWGTSPRSYANASNFGLSSEATLQLEAGKTYYLAVQGVDKSGVPGEFSEEITALVKGSDTTPPVISGVSISSITSSAATIAWSTNEEAYVQVEYGKSTALGTFSGLTTISAAAHRVTLNGLSSATTYYFRMIAKDLSGNQVLSEILNFRTKDGPEDPNNDSSLKFTEITLSSVSNTSVTINWTTNIASTGLVEYGVDHAFDLNAVEASFLTRRSTRLLGLSPSTLYRYRITAIEANGNKIISGVLMFKTSDRVSQPSQPSPEAIFISSVVETQGFRTNLGINNLSSSVANVTLTLVDPAGLVRASKVAQVQPNGLKQINSVGRFLDENSFGSDIQGNIYLESDQPISAWASQITKQTDDPSLLLSKRNGAVKLLIPSAANISTFRSSLVVMNVGLSPAQVTLRAFSTDGALLGQTPSPLSIPAQGVLSIDNALESLGVTDNYGPLEITSTNNVPLIASSRVSSNSGSGGFFEGLPIAEAAPLQLIPHVVDSAALRTNVGINNPGSQPATVTIKLLDKDGQLLGSGGVVVSPNGLTQINNVVRQLLGRGDLTGVDGSIRLEANQPILAWASQIDNVTNDPGFALGKSSGSAKVLVQSTANVGSFKSSLVVVNAGSGTAIVDILSRDSEGKVNGERRNIVIPAGGHFSTGNVLEALNVFENYGPVEVISTNGQPILATSRVFSTSGTSGFFEAQRVD